MSEEETIVKKPGPKKGVSKEDFEELKSAVTEIMEMIKSQPKIQADSEGVKVVAPQTDDAGPQMESMVPQLWRSLADEILGKDFRLELYLPENGGQIVKVFVPREKSNAGKDHWDRYGVDRRSKELGNTGVSGVKTWLLKIRKNLVTSGIKLPYYEDTVIQGGISTR